ncbi:2-phospho-L-lactate transferase CofD family protein [Amycolatopsis sp. NPDC059021]|uniref:2-phospho-L-lactate transferase CofD family protein n=1 Tax=Amycolatopsis sp. NPDC059021 TaxID=3346704 RepID=UPI00366AB0A6
MIVGLGGGTGSSRLWRALAGRVPPDEFTIVVNTADDFRRDGLRICPDLDTTLAALSGMDSGAALGLAGPRTERLRAGDGLAEITRGLAAAAGVRVSVLPMTEQEVSTRLNTFSEENLRYQEFLDDRDAEPAVASVRYDGIDEARPAPGVLEAIGAAELVVLGPSNPLAGVLPILRIPGVAAALRDTHAEIVAVTPVVYGVPITDPAEHRRARSRAALMHTVGLPAIAVSVAKLHRGVCDRFVLDRADAAEAGRIRALGLEVDLASTLIARADPGELVDTVLAGSRY